MVKNSNEHEFSQKDEQKSTWQNFVKMKHKVFNLENIGNNPFQDTKLLPNKDSVCNSIKITHFLACI